MLLFKALRVSMEEQRARQEQEARRGQAASSTETTITRPETINESKCTDLISKIKIYAFKCKKKLFFKKF